MIYIDGYILKKNNGMSNCLKSILMSIPCKYKKNITIFIPSRLKNKYEFLSDFNLIYIKSSFFLAWEFYKLAFHLNRIASSSDIILFPANTGGFFIKNKVKKVVILHDVMFFNLRKVGSLKQLMSHVYYTLNFIFHYRSYSKIVTVSEFSKSEIVKKVKKIKNNNVHVILEAARDFPFPQKPNAELPPSFILAPCLRDPRKSTKEVVEAFSAYKKKGGKYNLILFGDHEYFSSFVIDKKIEPSIKMLGRISDAELSYLYKNAEFFMFCSKFEGFGLPILEAMKFGCPVVSVRNSSIPEIGGDAIYYIEPDFTHNVFVERITYSMFALENTNLCYILKMKGFLRVKRFNWKYSSDSLLRLLLTGIGE